MSQWACRLALTWTALVLGACAVKPPPSVAEHQMIAYCYQTIADVDCYTTPVSDRAPLAVMRTAHRAPE